MAIYTREINLMAEQTYQQMFIYFGIAIFSNYLFFIGSLLFCIYSSFCFVVFSMIKRWKKNSVSNLNMPKIILKILFYLRQLLFLKKNVTIYFIYLLLLTLMYIICARLGYTNCYIRGMKLVGRKKAFHQCRVFQR